MLATFKCYSNVIIRSDDSLKANTHDAISCTQPFSNSLICKLSLLFQHNSTKESYDTSCVYWPLGCGEIVPHFWYNTLLLSALLGKNKEIVLENDIVGPTMLYSFTQAFAIHHSSQFH